MPQPTLRSVATWPIIGHEQVLSFLHGCVARKTTAHAYIFSGPRGCGKFLTAQYFAASLLCDGAAESAPCMKCLPCSQFFKKTHPDVTTVTKAEGKKNISVEQIRELQHALTLRSFLTSFKTAIIDGAHDLSEEAANALLKTLEEPSEKTVIILVADDASRLPRTIVSRCQTLFFHEVERKAIEHWLRSRGVPIAESHLIAHLSLGRPGVAAELADNKEALKLHNARMQALTALHGADGFVRLQLAASVLKEIEPEQLNDYSNTLLDGWMLFYRDIILSHFGVPFLTNLSYKSSLAGLAEKMSVTRMLRNITSIKRAKQLLSQSVSPKLVIENLALTI